MEVDDVLKGLSSLMSYRNVMNYTYSPHANKALQFPQKYLFNIEKPEVNDSVRELSIYVDLSQRA